MPKNELKDFKSKTVPELKALLAEAQKGLSKIRLETATKKIKNVRLLFFQKKKIARLLTLIRVKELENA